MGSNSNFVRWVLGGAVLLAGNVVAAETPSSALLVLNKEEATLAIVDLASGKVVGRVPTGEGPHEVAVSSDGKLAFVGNYGSRTPGKSRRSCGSKPSGCSPGTAHPRHAPH